MIHGAAHDYKTAQHTFVDIVSVGLDEIGSIHASVFSRSELLVLKSKDNH